MLICVPLILPVWVHCARLVSWKSRSTLFSSLSWLLNLLETPNSLLLNVLIFYSTVEKSKWVWIFARLRQLPTFKDLFTPLRSLSNSSFGMMVLETQIILTIVQIWRTSWINKVVVRGEHIRVTYKVLIQLFDPLETIQILMRYWARTYRRFCWILNHHIFGISLLVWCLILMAI